MKRLFEIQTLSESTSNLNDYTSLQDPVTVIMGIGATISSLFPNLFGSEKTSKEVFNKLFPSDGYWTSQYKNWLLQRIKYVKDIERDLHMYTGQFIEANQAQICKGGAGVDCWNNFYKLLQQEAVTGGVSPVGNIFGASLDYQTLLLLGGGILLVVMLAKKKRRSRGKK
jgi:hypothetical protein